MVKCSGVRKANCADPCTWVVGKGCKNLNLKPRAPAAKKAGAFDGAVFYFSGFRNDKLKEAVQAKGAKFSSSLSDKVTHLVYVLSAKNKSKVEAASAPKKYTLDAFAGRYKLKSLLPPPAKPVVADAETKKQTTKKAKSPEAYKPVAPVKTVSHGTNEQWWKKHFELAAYDERLGDMKFSPVKESTFEKPLDRNAATKITYKGRSLRSLTSTMMQIIVDMNKKHKFNSKDFKMPHIGVLAKALFYVPKKDMFVIVAKVNRKDTRKAINLVAFECTFDPKKQWPQFNIRAYFDLESNVPSDKLNDHKWLLERLTPQFDHKVHLLVSVEPKPKKSA